MTQVTDENAKGSYLCNISMRFFTQAVTVVLLLVLGAVPMLGAVPCQKQMQSPMCCSPGCSMMTMMGNTGAQARIQRSDLGPPCCKMIPHTPVTMVAPAKSRVLIEVMLVGETIDAHVPHMTLPIVEERAQSNPRMCGRSQSILCTFRI